MSNSTYIMERNAELFLRYYEARKNNPKLTCQQAIRQAVNSPTSRHFVSLIEVYREILNILHGRQPSSHMKSIRRQQIDDIYRIYCELAAKPTFKGASPFFIVQFAIAEPAPHFYLSYSRARDIIWSIKHSYEIEDTEA